MRRRSPMRTKFVVFFLFAFARQLSIANSPEENIRSEARNPVISHIPRDRVASDVIASAGYSRRRHILEIEFVNGAVYRYLRVPPSVYQDLIQADSKARYYVTNIKGSYPSLRVRPRVKDQAD
jgi:hypothetical protein